MIAPFLDIDRGRAPRKKFAEPRPGGQQMFDATWAHEINCLVRQLCRGASALCTHCGPPAGVVGSHPCDRHRASRLHAPTLIVGISALATAVDVNPWLLLIAATVGAIAGDGLSFWLGQRYHQKILLGWPLNRYPQFIGRGEAFINRYGVTSVFLARFTAVARAFVPLVAGILGMPPRQFYAANVLSALAWAPAHVFPGVLLAMAISLAGASAGQLNLPS
jgi:membrane protein YqaA with SNARE-associated domain